MKSYFAYVRVSTVKQGEGVSLEAQKEAIETFAAREGMHIEQWFEEKVTAAKKGRPLFNKMLKELRAGKAEGVVFHKIDRSARNFADWAKIHELADAGVAIHIATESIDFNSRGGRLTADIQAVIAADYIRNLREECLKGMRGRLKQGLMPFGAPLGYLNNGKGKPKTLDPVRAPLVKQAFELYATGEYSLHGLREEMTKRGLLSRNDKPLTKRGFESILDNPFYCGVIVIKSTGESFAGIHEKLISTELFAQVRDVREGRAGKGKKKYRHNYAYRGLFICGLCRTSMIAERQRGHVYYRCHTKDCPTTCLREEVLEEQIRSYLEFVRFEPTDIQAQVSKFQVWQKAQDTSQDGATIPMQLEQIDGKLERLTDALIDRLIEKDAHNERREKLLLERAKLEEKQRAHDRQKPVSPHRLRKFLEQLKSQALLYENANQQERREIVRIAASNAWVKGKTAYFELSKLHQQCGVQPVFPYGEPLGPNPRRRPRMQSDIEQQNLEGE